MMLQCCACHGTRPGNCDCACHDHDDCKQEIERLQAELAGKECTCGSGAHPRRCLKHPQGFDLHVTQLNYESAQDTIQELQKELEQAKELERQLREALTRLEPYVDPVVFRLKAEAALTVPPAKEKP